MTLDGSQAAQTLKALESDCDTLELRWQQVHGAAIELGRAHKNNTRKWIVKHLK